MINSSKVGHPSFLDGFWWPSWIYADYESFPKLPAWQQS